jgi:hypothetical protein
MALFGAPIAHERHAAQACRAALELTRAMDRVFAELAPTMGTTLGVRVGLNSGEVVVGRIGDNTRIGYTAQGLAVHLAARMEQIAEVGQIFVAPSTAALVSDDFELVAVGERAVKGIAEPILVHRLLGRAVPSRARGAASKTRPTTLVGRAAELGVLRTALSDARVGEPCVVTITAPAGYGKSRLVAELLEEARLAGDDVISVVGDSTRVPGPMWTIAVLARALLGLEADDEAVDAALARLTLDPGTSVPLRNRGRRYCGRRSRCDAPPDRDVVTRPGGSACVRRRSDAGHRHR